MRAATPGGARRAGNHRGARASTATPNILGNNGAYDPGFLQNACNLQSIASTAGSGATVAIVDACDDRMAASDLAYYRSYFGLPPYGSGCFTRVNQYGQQAAYPRPNSSWAQESWIV